MKASLPTRSLNPVEEIENIGSKLWEIGGNSEKEGNREDMVVGSENIGSKLWGTGGNRRGIENNSAKRDKHPENREDMGMRAAIEKGTTGREYCVLAKTREDMGRIGLENRENIGEKWDDAKIGGIGAQIGHRENIV